MQNIHRYLRFIAVCLFVTVLASCTATQGRESTGQYLDNSAVTLKVKSDLAQDRHIKSFPITVKTYKGTVQLSGFVDTEAQRRRAGAIAAQVKGVTAVQNDLVVKRR